MARVIFENLTPEQALALSDWYEGQGEQDAYVWLTDMGLNCANTDVSRPGGYRDIHANGDVTVYIRK